MVSLGNTVVKITILLTAFVGFMLPVCAQVERTDTIRQTGSTGYNTDSAKVAPDSLSDKFKLSTDSVYATPGPEKQGMLESMVEYTASDSIVGSVAEGVAHLYRDGYVKYQDLTLKAGYIRVNFNTNEVYAEGIKDTAGNIIQKPVFTEGGKSYRADNMRYNFDTKKAKISKVITQEGEGFLHGEDVKKMEEDVFYIKNAAYTTCSHEEPHFHIKTPKAKVIAGKQIITKFAFLEILDIPTPLMVPFGFFPTAETRKSGLILPSYGSSEYRGYFLRGGGYYWAISDYIDLSLTGDIYTQGGFGVTAESSYRKRYKYSGSFNVSYNRLSFGNEEFQEFVPSAFEDRTDFAIRWNHAQDPKARPDFRFNSNVNIATSDYYRVTSTDADQVLTNNLASSVSFQKSFPGKPYNLNVSFNHDQNNRTRDMTLKLPQVAFAVNRQFPFRREVQVGQKKWYEEIGITYSASGQNTIRTKIPQAGQPFFAEGLFRDSSRAGIRHDIPIGANYKVFKFFVFNPSINYTERWYFQQSEYGFVDSLNRAMVVDTNVGFYGVRDFQGSANLSTKLYGTWQYNGYLRAIRHVMTPTVGLSYRPDFSEDFWGYYQEVQVDTAGNTERRGRYANGIYGQPASGKSGNINFGIQNTLEAKVRSKSDTVGVKKIKLLERISLNTSYNMAAEKFKWAPLGLTMSSSAFDNVVRMNYNATFDLYGYDPVKNEEVNRPALEVNGKLLRPTSQRFTLGLNLNASRFQKGKDKKGPPQGLDNDEKEGLIDELEDPNALGVTTGDIDYYSRRGFVDFNVPWSMNLNYNIRKNYTGLETTITQSVDASGDMELTENWRMGFRTGYDIQAKELTYTSFDFYRNLHCWELRASWIPFGFQQSYNITIRVKSQILKDLKLERRRGVGDFQR